MGHAGFQVRRILEQHQLCFVNTFFGSGPTVVGPGHSSRIDLCVSPNCCERMCSKCHVLQQLGKSVQKCNVSCKRDYFPLYLECIVRCPVQRVDNKCS